MTEEGMPHNLIVTSSQVTAEQDVTPQVTGLPSERLILHWRYANRSIQLYERRLRSLRGLGVGAPLQAWVRSRLEWLRDNRLPGKPAGSILIDIDPEGAIDVSLQDALEVPSFTTDDLLWDNGVLAGCAVGVSVWVVTGSGIVVTSEWEGAAADTFAKDLVVTTGHEIIEDTCSTDDLQGAEIFAIDDAYGIIACEGTGGPVTDKLTACFDKLWSL